MLANFEPYDPLRGLLQDQQSTFKGSYSPKSLHKLVLPENVFISNFLEVEMNEKCPKVIYQVILDIFGTLWPTQMTFIVSIKYIKWLVLSQTSP